jgi:ubiquinone/menaquinone biosynthesis C-methylase UbiE
MNIFSAAYAICTERRRCMVDYSDVYDDYWQRPDRMGESSFEDPSSLARQILATCGPGRILDIGCGMGALVRELLKQGADAYGVDVSSVAAAQCNRFTPGRFHAGSVLALPFPDESFDTLISTDCLEHLAPEDVPLALLEMHRVCRRNLFLCVATGPDRDGHWHLTIEKRGWWEDAAFSAGFRKHPLYYAITPFHALEEEGNSITIPLERISNAALSRYPLKVLVEQRDLHMDMTRETGRRSDAHMARYHLVANYIRDGDTVLDAACGMGYGSNLLAWQSAASRVIGADIDHDAVVYATENFSSRDGRLSFRVADAQRLDFMPDNSVDLFVSFETLEHVPHPETLIAEAKRVLRPSGRIIVSVPNLWVNEKGVDPNPHHLHVYDWTRLVKEIRSHFLLEAAYAQTAGGGMKLSKHHRSLFAFSPEGKQPAEAEWWLAVGMKDPVESKNVTYLETALHWKGEPPNAVAFARDYENPWLIRGIVSIGWRNRNSRQRTDLAQRALTASSAGSPDAGAALCVLAYAMLEAPDRPTPASVDVIASQIDSYVALNDPRPQCRRWAISLMYVRGLLWQSIGELGKSLDSFRNCAVTDPLVYSPLLATKTVDACRLAGMLSFEVGNRADARTFWSRGISLAEQALRGNWREIHGDIEHPFTFGLREAAQILDIASRCADGIHHLDFHVEGSGLLYDGSFVARLKDSDKLLEKANRYLAEMQSTPYIRLQKAVQNDPPSIHRLARITYLLAVIFLPARLKTTLRPVANYLRQRFK